MIITSFLGGDYFVQRPSAVYFQSLELCGRKTGQLFKLGGKVGGAAVTQVKCDFRKGSFVVDQELFHPFDLLVDDELFDGDSFHFRKKIGQIRIVVVQVFGDDLAGLFF